MTKAKKETERSVIANAPALSGPAGTGPGQRLYMAIGPNCWGRGMTAAEAVKNAKANAPRHLGAPKWGFILYDVQSDATIDGMGSICYVPREGEQPYITIGRFNVPKSEN